MGKTGEAALKSQFIKRLILVAVVGVPLCGCAQKIEKVDAYKINPNAHSAVTPVPRSDAWWTKRHQAILDRVKNGNVDLIFIGDSITHLWEGSKGNENWQRYATNLGLSGEEVWKQYYLKRNAVNMGFSGDQTQHVLWRLDHGEISGISPKLAIVMIGTNNDNTAREIGDGIIAICKKLRKDLPHTKILLLAIFPRDEHFSTRRQKNAEASGLAATIADSKWIYYMDINDKFLDQDGTLPKVIMPDFVHPNSKGYQIEAEAIEPMVKKLADETK